MPQKRRCTKCSKLKTLQNFDKAPKGKFGRAAQCRRCKNEYLREYRKTAKGQAIEKAWRTSPEGRASKAKFAKSERGRQLNAMLKSEHRRDGRYTAQKKAYDAVYYALKKGTLTKPSTCQRCKQVARVQAHHADYAKPLDVEWLCRACHVAHHEAEKV